MLCKFGMCVCMLCVASVHAMYGLCCLIYMYVCMLCMYVLYACVCCMCVCYVCMLCIFFMRVCYEVLCYVCTVRCVFSLCVNVNVCVYVNYVFARLTHYVMSVI